MIFIILIILFLFLIYFNIFSFSFYQIVTSYRAIYELFSLTKQDIIKCNIAYKFMEECSEHSDTDSATKHIKNYYKVLNIFLSIADIEKMYIPPHINEREGLFQNQLIIEKKITKALNANNNSKILDIGCGKGRIAHHVYELTKSKIYGYNIDEYQINNAINYTRDKNLDSKINFTVADHHKTLPYDNDFFDGSYSYQALWPFLNKNELKHSSSELYRVLKPGGIYSCSEYVITGDFDFNNIEHQNLHKLFLPTLAATQSNYPSDIVNSLKDAGFDIIVSKPSDAPTWTLTTQKTNLIIIIKYIAIMLSKLGLIYPEIIILIENLLKGGEAWKIAEKAKLADLNWQIIAKKPTSSLKNNPDTYQKKSI